MVTNFEKAITNKEFFPLIQPQYNPRTNELIGGEALVRWRLDDGTVLSPDKFIDVFERRLLVEKIDFYLFEYVCVYQRKLIDSGTKAVPISVNFSRTNLYNTHFAEKLCSICDLHNVPRHLFSIEITETAYIRDTESTLSLLEEIRKQGFRIMLDDFGSGFATYASLLDMPINVVKIDRSLALSALKSEKSRNAFICMTKAFKALSIQVLIEGVEEQEQVDFFKESGCYAIQGYYYSKPISEEEFSNLLE